MGWLSKIFGGSSNSHRISEGHNYGRYGEDSNWDGPTTSGGAWSDNENEDIDRAIALSLAEEEARKQEKDQKGKQVIDHDSQLEEDELLAKALQESLNLESPAQTPPQTPPRPPPPQYDRGNMLQPYPFFSYGYRHCGPVVNLKWLWNYVLRAGLVLVVVLRLVMDDI